MAKNKKPKRIKPVETKPAKNYDKACFRISMEHALCSGPFSFRELDKEHKAAFADSVYSRSKLTWVTLKKSDRHALGYEKIPLRQIRGQKPRVLTPDVEDVIAFRFHGRAPMVGYRDEDIFYVIWFDPGYKLYPH